MRGPTRHRSRNSTSTSTTPGRLRRRKGTSVAFSGNNGETKNGRIDYIYYSKSAKLTVKSSQVYDTRDSNGVMPSDHRPVLTAFTVQ